MADSEGTSRDAAGEPLRRIKRALSLWSCTGYVEFDDKPRIHDWLEQNLDRSKYTNRELARLMCEHVVRRRGRVKEQDNQPGYEADAWYSVELALENKKVFIKFILEPDEADDPGILIVSIH
jgi:hypothetical protein